MPSPRKYPPPDPPSDADAFVRMEYVERATGLTRHTIYREIRAGKFPRQRQLSPQTVGWSVAELNEWLRSRPTVDSEAA
jgi:prophage regulatory protein